MIDAIFKFHPIGQGCFYTGKIVLNNTNHIEFNFVYDCGTDSKMSFLENEIDIYKASLSKKTIDLLIISHFDQDHVNGIIRLLSGIKCERLIIPYYNPIERLLVFTTLLESDDEYIQMLQSPINFFSNDRFNIEEIIIIGSPEDENGIFTNKNPDDIPPKLFDEIDFEGLKNIEFKADFIAISEKKKILDEIEAIEGKLKNTQKLNFLNFNSVKINFWEFVFYLKKHENDILINKFQKDVDIILDRENIKLLDMFDEDFIIQLKDAYRQYFGKDLNNTSLVTYHGPIANFKNHYNYFSKFSNYFHEYTQNCMGSLLTGDINIKSKLQSKKMIDYFAGLIPKVCFFQVPHHGAKANWNFNVPNGLNFFNNYIINHGVGRIHHPSVDVVQYIKTNNTIASIHLNNEAQDFEYGFHIFK